MYFKTKQNSAIKLLAATFIGLTLIAVMANPRCALFFANGLLLFADPAWGKPKPPCIEIGAADLTVLYDAMVVGIPVVYLPPNWKEALGRE